MNFSQALAAIKNGSAIRRKNWYKVHMVLAPNPTNLNKIEFTVVSETASMLTRWVSTEEDILAEDWEIEEK